VASERGRRAICLCSRPSVDLFNAEERGKAMAIVSMGPLIGMPSLLL
jgi:hypothetical protein